MRRRSSFAARQSADSTAKEGSMSQRTWQSEHAAVVHGLAAATGRHAPGAEICKAGIAERVLIDIRQLAPRSPRAPPRWRPTGASPTMWWTF
jgi:hypothetical protein